MATGRRLDQMCDVAARLFSRQGYHGTTIREIARAIDLQGGSLYAHIAGKEDLLWAICRRAADQFEAAVAPIVAADLDPAARLRAALRAHIGVVAADLDAAAVYFHEWRFLSETRREAIRRRRDAYEAHFRRIVDQGRAAGAFATDDSRFPAILALSAGNWLAQWFRSDGPLTSEAVADRFADLLLFGLDATHQHHVAPAGEPALAARR